MKITGRAVSLAVAALLVTGPLLGASALSRGAEAAPVAASEEYDGTSARLLREVRTLSGELRNAAEELVSVSRSNHNWESHGGRLNALREKVNQIGLRLARLQELGDSAPVWHQSAVVRVMPAAATIAAHTQAAIEFLNENKRHLFAPEYADHLQAIVEGAGEMKASLDTSFETAKTEQEVDRLQQKLDQLKGRADVAES